MKAIILAAGRGRRMKSFTLKKPKPLLIVGGKTFLEHILDSLPSEVEKVIMVVGYKGDQIKKKFKDKYKSKKIQYVFQKTLDGTGPALLLAKPHFKKNERFLIFYGDELVRKKEVKDCLSHKFSWLCRYADIPEKSGVATLSSRDQIIKVTEKPKRPASNLVIAGIMVVDSDLFEYKPTKHWTGEYYLTSMMDRFIKNHFVHAVAGIDNLYFTSPKDIENFNKKRYNTI